MKLIEAIVAANERWVRGEREFKLDRAEHSESLPIAVLICIDERLDQFIPGAFGLERSDFQTVRVPGNIVGEQMGGIVRAIVLACVVKSAREIAVIGHTDCGMAKMTVLRLTDTLAAMGVTRDKLPDDLNEFFGLFASERQNVISAVEVLRQSPLIGPSVPVHGLLMDIKSGRLEWLVNGYQTGAAVGASESGSEFRLCARVKGREVFEARMPMASLSLGELKFPEIKIGEVTVAAAMESTRPHEQGQTASVGSGGAETGAVSGPDWFRLLREVAVAAIRVQVQGNDKRVYGPVPITKLLEWAIEKRVGPDTLTQVEGTTAWQPLVTLLRSIKEGDFRVPPPIPRAKKSFRLFGWGEKR